MTDTHTHIYICLSLGHLSGYLYLTLQVFKRYVGIALNHQLHMHSNSSKNRYTNIFVHIIYIYCMLMYLCIYIYILYVDVSMYMAMSIYIISLQVFSKVADRYRQVQTTALWDAACHWEHSSSLTRAAFEPASIANQPLSARQPWHGELAAAVPVRDMRTGMMPVLGLDYCPGLLFD